MTDVIKHYVTTTKSSKLKQDDLLLSLQEISRHNAIHGLRTLSIHDETPTMMLFPRILPFLLRAFLAWILDW